ncbi:MAG TPA: asparagine synthase (glutamine-hydrolyzing), partial [Verrucomicrobiae bacterium]|nr:asparagine synthase (glutamine-hydrolyzing) [Verrucomicrobiae bacterium]
MCGITGWIDWEQDLTQRCSTLEEMTDALTPRGPDAVGFWFSSAAAFGHRRLVVVDPAGGIQPMLRTRGEQKFILVYNGELYNTPELRQKLADLGHTFSGHSDTEVLLKAYIAWGETCVDKFNGIFAFAVWDEAKQSLFLARDRMGVKPLFYVHKHNSLLFASELKALLAHPDIQPQLDLEGLAEVLVMGPARTPGHGIFRGVQELRPGFCAVFNHNGFYPRRYWNVESKPHEDNLSTTISRVRELFLDTVRRQLVSDVPICTFLSGGLDSSAITAVAAQTYQAQGLGSLKTFSVDYRDNDKYFQASAFQPNADTHWIEMMSREFDTDHSNIIIDTPQLVDALHPAVIARDQPGMADVDSSLLLFCREIKKHATVALSGECADEIFGGYPWFHSPEALAAATFPWARNVTEKARVFNQEIMAAINPEHYLQQRYLTTIAEVPAYRQDSPTEARMREMFYLNLNWFMSTLLDRKDRMSMATGLEVRVPFCDHRLVEYVWNIPWDMKFFQGRE